MTLGYAKRLRDCGIAAEHAEAHAEAARDFIMMELFTNPDALALKQELQTSIENLGLRLAIHLGVLLAACVVALAAIQSLS